MSTDTGYPETRIDLREGSLLLRAFGAPRCQSRIPPNEPTCAVRSRCGQTVGVVDLGRDLTGFRRYACTKEGHREDVEAQRDRDESIVDARHDYEAEHSLGIASAPATPNDPVGLRSIRPEFGN
jgi:hypothetical protein